MVRAGICYGQMMPLVFTDSKLTAQRYIHIVLQPFVFLFVRQHNVTFQQDNNCAYAARVSMAYL